MKMSFNSDRAWAFLTAKGYVFTYRIKSTSRPQPLLTPISLWRLGRNMNVNALRLKIAEGPGIDLEFYTAYSGFQNVDEWKGEIGRLNKVYGGHDLSEMSEKAVLYYVHDVRG